jgi:hypothetical protein
MARAKCRCDCGRVKVIRLAHLESGATRSCGCRGGARTLHPPLRIGNRYTRWTVVAHSMRKRYVLCRCDCGATREVLINALKAGQAHSCGCIRAGMPLQKKYAAIIGGSGEGLGLPSTASGRTCAPAAIAPRVSDLRATAGRGIRVARRWLGPNGYVNFLRDMGRRPGSGFDLDRIDSMKGYAPGNTRWLPRADNLKRPRPGRHKPLCKHGHRLTSANTTTDSRGGRRCRACHRTRERQRRNRNAAA